MTTLFVVAMAAAFVITAVEELLMPLDKLKGLIALIMSTVGCLVMRPFDWDQVFYVFAATFLALTVSVVVESLFTGRTRREELGLPKRIPPLQSRPPLEGGTMRSPISDPSLSLAAKGLYAFFLEIGRVASVDEMSAAHPESKYAMTKAMKELKDGHYIKAVRFQQNAGQWNTLLKFSDPKLNLYVTEADTPNTSVLSTVSTIAIDNSTSTANSSNIDTVTNVTVSIGAAPLEKKGTVMTWPTFDEEQPERKKYSFRVQEESDATPGAVGKVEDKAALRNKKYKKNKFMAVPESMRRNERPEDQWTTSDLVAEFYDLNRDADHGAPSQVNGKHLTTWLNKMVGEGVTRLALLKAMRMFFADPRLTRDAGVGSPLYSRFIAYYQSVHGIVSRVAETVYEDEDMKAHQEKMLKLLEG